MKNCKDRREKRNRQLFALGAALLIATLVVPENAHAFASVQFAIKEICGHMQGKLGGLLMTVSAVGGLAAAALGNLRAMQSMIITGIGAATVGAFLSLYFAKAGAMCITEGDTPEYTQGTPAAPPGRVVNHNFDLTAGDVADAPLERGGLDSAAVNTALNRDVDFSNAPLPPAQEEEAGDSVFDQDFSSDEGADEF